MEEVKKNPREDGSLLYADGHPVGYCTICRFSQPQLYYLDNNLYCIACFPKAVELKIALEKIKEFNERNEKK